MDVDSWEEHRILGDFPASALVFSGSLQEPTVKLPTKVSYRFWHRLRDDTVQPNTTIHNQPISNCSNHQIDRRVENLEIESKYHLYHPGNTFLLGVTIYIHIHTYIHTYIYVCIYILYS
jgi:hypothetical protein